jgi:hypothetical protein
MRYRIGLRSSDGADTPTIRAVTVRTRVMIEFECPPLSMNDGYSPERAGKPSPFAS